MKCFFRVDIYGTINYNTQNLCEPLAETQFQQLYVAWYTASTF